VLLAQLQQAQARAYLGATPFFDGAAHGPFRGAPARGGSRAADSLDELLDIMFPFRGHHRV
jgi:hypothetical protein